MSYHEGNEIDRLDQRGATEALQRVMVEHFSSIIGNDYAINPTEKELLRRLGYTEETTGWVTPETPGGIDEALIRLIITYSSLNCLQRVINTRTIVAEVFESDYFEWSKYIEIEKLALEIDQEAYLEEYNEAQYFLKMYKLAILALNGPEPSSEQQ
ncbi:MAG: hypothetical protein QY318_02375 [Candidatus Dojkabacteria bacterium]|nr:MAG: hypothetical protein QY318_02375 [Candidatus Dojkabacteria bacterium]